MVAIQPFSLADRVGHVALVVYGGMRGHNRGAMERYLELRTLYSDIIRMVATLRRGGHQSMVVDDRGLHHPGGDTGSFHDFAVEVEREGQWSRKGYWAHRWATDIVDLTQYSLSTVVLGRGPENVEALRKESEAVLAGFRKIPGFSKGFERENRIPFEEFCRVIDALAMVAYESPCDAAVLPRERFMVEVCGRMNLSAERVTAILDRFDEHARDTLARPLIPLSNGHWTTSFEWASQHKFLEIEKYFYGRFPPSERGRVLENRCDEMLNGEGYSTKCRHEVVYPEDLSRRLGIGGRKPKKRGDIDVLAHLSGTLILVECKQIRPGAPISQMSHGRGEVTQASARMSLLAEWLARSAGSLEALIPRSDLSKLGIDYCSPLNIVPLVVTNHDLGDRPTEGAPVLYFGDLKGLWKLPSKIVLQLSATPPDGLDLIRLPWSNGKTIISYLCGWTWR